MLYSLSFSIFSLFVALRSEFFFFFLSQSSHLNHHLIKLLFVRQFVLISCFTLSALCVLGLAMCIRVHGHSTENLLHDSLDC